MPAWLANLTASEGMNIEILLNSVITTMPSWLANLIASKGMNIEIICLTPYLEKLDTQGFGLTLIFEGERGGVMLPLKGEGILYDMTILPILSPLGPLFLTVEELSDMTAIKAEDILATLQSLELIQYRKGQHVICADPKVLDRHLKAAGRGGLEVDVTKLIWTPYKEQN
ncbi:unnamed protein product [Ilex paraguariensis]|uniref:Histone acetyltransferase n=1 Tax=Ilex paraguariensis TaxID=185542 RepID=A0ABC8TV75_9AQUA